jgi:peptidoglycan/xylan/chitin deacetylase (PgdA/CDA1 family)
MKRSLFRRITAKLVCHLPTKPVLMRNTAPMVSITFDDVPESAYVNGAALLDEYGIRGTFYVAIGNCGTMDTYWRVIGRDQVRDLDSRGHEIGCHTFTHRAVDTLDSRGLEDECRRNLDSIRELCPGIELKNFCYPFGCLSLPRKRQLQKRFDSCRGISEGINSGIVDLGYLKVIELYQRTLTREKLDRVLHRARERSGWIVFYAHDVAEQPTHMGCSPALLRDTIEAIRGQKIQCVSVRQALAAIGDPSKPAFSGELANPGSIALP